MLSDRYMLDERIASGGMGEVWRGHDPVLGRTVAIKVLLPALVSDAEFITRFRTEARMMAALRHAGIVQVHDYGADALLDDSPRDYLVMEYVEGPSLAQRIMAAGKLEIAETLSVVTQAADALHVAHAAGIVHRDVKPSNLLIRPDATVVLVDFGVARSIDLTGITTANMVVGSPQYMAPEQATGQAVSPATDVYALGAVTYCCLTGRPPLTGDGPVQVIAQLLHGDPPTLPGGIPAPVADLVLRALSRDPARRFPSAAAFAEAARAASGRALPPAPPAKPPPGALAFPASPGPAPASAGPAFPSPAPAAPAVPAFPGPAPAVPAFPGPASAEVRPGAGRGNKRRNVVLAGVAALLVAAAALSGSLALRSEAHPSRLQAKASDQALAPGSAGQPSLSGQPSTDGPTSAVATVTPGQPTVSPAAQDETPPASSLGTSPEPNVPGAPTPSAPAASAAPSSRANPYTAVQVCGSGYKVIDSARLAKADGTLLATVYLLYHAGTGTNCTVTLKRTSVGTATSASALLQPKGGTKILDTGKFAYYAGPARAKAAKVCVMWGGTAGGVSYTSPFEHCT